MKYQIGDDIILLSTKEEGKIVEFINESMVSVQINGVTFPVHFDQIDFPYFYRFTTKKMFDFKPSKTYIDDIPKEKEKAPEKLPYEGVWLILIPSYGINEWAEDAIELFKVYLANRNPEDYTFIYSQKFFGKEEFAVENTINANKEFYLFDLLFADLNDSPSFDFEFTLAVRDTDKEDHYAVSYKPKAKQMLQEIIGLKDKNLPTISIELFNTYPMKSFNELDSVIIDINKNPLLYRIETIKTNIQEARPVIDLHIEKLIDDWNGKSNFEILSIQLKEFEKWYDIALANRQLKLIVIHGIGIGRLKREIHELLKDRKEVKRYFNDYNPLYGFGATEIHFEY